MLLALGLGTPAQADAVARWHELIAQASSRFGVPASWIGRVMRAESGGYTMRAGRPIRSAKGAIGLMQLMPQTWALLRERLGLGADADDPRDNILAGTYYLRRLYDRFGYPGLFAAYNAGPRRYAAFLDGQRPLPRETRAYLALLRAPEAAATAGPAARPQGLFALRGDAFPIPLTAAEGDRLFALRRPLP